MSYLTRFPRARMLHDGEEPASQPRRCYDLLGSLLGSLERFGPRVWTLVTLLSNLQRSPSYLYHPILTRL